jgi:hypothetical protein
MNRVPRKPCKTIRLDELCCVMTLDDSDGDGVVDTTVRPIKLSKRERKYLELPKSVGKNAKKKR